MRLSKQTSKQGTGIWQDARLNESRPQWRTFINQAPTVSHYASTQLPKIDTWPLQQPGQPASEVHFNAFGGLR